MIFIYIILLIVLFIILGININFYFKTKKIKIQKIIEQNQYDELITQYSSLKEQCELYSNQLTQLSLDIIKEKEKNDLLYEKEKEKLNKQIKIYKENLSYASSQYFDTLEQNYEEKEYEYDKQIQDLERKKTKCQKEILEMQQLINAGIDARQRELELQQNAEFYKLTLSNDDLEDVKQLEQIKRTLHQPLILSKLIWSTYFQKQTTEMCNRILGTSKVCGIYKITNLKTQQCYIGQSVDIAQRIKSHCKCGLGIEASATNKLYNAMQKDGIYSFSFELLEQCPREQLNEKEKFWIQTYQSNSFGYNLTKGNN